jgi:hypothetical protein
MVSKMVPRLSSPHVRSRNTRTLSRVAPWPMGAGATAGGMVISASLASRTATAAQQLPPRAVGCHAA